MGADHRARFFFGVYWDCEEGEDWPPELYQHLAKHFGLDTEGVDEWDLKELIEEKTEIRDITDGDEILDVLLNTKRSDYPDEYNTWQAARKEARIKAFGANIHFGFTGAGDYSHTAIAYVIEGDDNGYGGTDYRICTYWDGIADAGEVMKKAVLDGKVKAWETALNKLGDMLPGASKPGWYVGCWCD